MNIFDWTCTLVKSKGVAGLSILKGVDSQWAIDIQKGRKLPGAFPNEAYFQMNPEHPNENKLGDQHSNGETMVVIGPRLSEFVRNLQEPFVELLPVKIHDIKGKLSSSDYHIVHTTQIIDCLDSDAAMGAKRNPIAPDSLLTWNTLKLRKGDHKYPKIFRIKSIESFIFVREEVAKAIEALGLKQPYFKPLESVS